jgi:hypothetical protein
MDKIADFKGDKENKREVESLPFHLVSSICMISPDALWRQTPPSHLPSRVNGAPGINKEDAKLHRKAVCKICLARGIAG